MEPLLNKSDMGYISFSERVRDIVEERGYPKTGKDVVSLSVSQSVCISIERKLLIQIYILKFV